MYHCVLRVFANIYIGDIYYDGRFIYIGVIDGIEAMGCGPGPPPMARANHDIHENMYIYVAECMEGSTVVMAVNPKYIIVAIRSVGGYGPSAL